MWVDYLGGGGGGKGYVGSPLKLLGGGGALPPPLPTPMRDMLQNTLPFNLRRLSFLKFYFLFCNEIHVFVLNTGFYLFFFSVALIGLLFIILILFGTGFNNTSTGTGGTTMVLTG